MPEIQIGERKIGPAHPPFVMAEVGINHEGEFGKAIQMVDAAAEAGADCVKFQCHITEKEMIPTDMKPGEISEEGLWDITEGGALDDSVRHTMTKLPHLHFTTNEQAAGRVRGMGEEPWLVFNVGFPAIDLLAQGNYAKPGELAQAYGLDPDRPLVVFTQHSVTTEFQQAAEQIAPALEALHTLAQDGVQVIITYPNNDAGGLRIIAAIDAFAQARPHRNIQVHRSLGRYNYHGVLNLCGRAGRGACLGNSSSGIKETPALGCPAVNIGSRQRGRLRAANVLDAGYDKAKILAATQKALWDEDFRRLCRECDNPYGTGDAGVKIAQVLAEAELGPKLIQKKMIL